MSQSALSQGSALWDLSQADAAGAAQSGTTASTAAVTVKRISGAYWDGAAVDFDDIIPEQTAVFNASRWGEANTEALGFYRGDTLIGGAAVLVRSLPLVGSGIAIIKWGPVWRPAGEPAETADLAAILEALRDAYCVRRNFHVTVMPFADPEYSEPMCAALEDLGFRKGSMLAAPERYLVNTGVDAETLHKGLGQKWRYNLKKARKNTFDIRFADDAEGLETFLDLYWKMLERKKFLDSSAIASLPDLMATQSQAIRPRIVLVSHDGAITAGGVFEFSGERATYMFGATDDRALGLKAGYAMHWWLAEQLCAMERILWYDLGGNDIDAGLHQFKKGFVGKLGHILITPPRYHLATSMSASLVGSAIFAARDAKAAMTRAAHRFASATKK